MFEILCLYIWNCILFWERFSIMMRHKHLARCRQVWTSMAWEKKKQFQAREHNRRDQSRYNIRALLLSRVGSFMAFHFRDKTTWSGRSNSAALFMMLHENKPSPKERFDSVPIKLQSKKVRQLSQFISLHKKAHKFTLFNCSTIRNIFSVNFNKLNCFSTRILINLISVKLDSFQIWKLPNMIAFKLDGFQILLHPNPNVSKLEYFQIRKLWT